MRTKKKQNDNNRTRSRQVHLRMSPEEYDKFLCKLEKSGLSAQAFIIQAIEGVTIIDEDTRAEILDTCRFVREIQAQAKGMGVNTNQMAKVANTNGHLPTKTELDKLTEFNLKTGKEVGKICLLLNQLIRKLTPSQD